MTTVGPTPIEKEVQPAHGTRCTDTDCTPTCPIRLAQSPKREAVIPEGKWHPAAVGIIEIPPSNKSK